MKTLKEITSIKEIDILESIGAEVVFDAEECDLEPDFEDKADIISVSERYNNGNSAAWFTAHVTVKYKGFEAEDYLGGCSYNSFKEFTNTDNDYYQDMINQCIASINRDIATENADTLKWWNIRKAKNLIAPYGLHIVTSNVLLTV